MAGLNWPTHLLKIKGRLSLSNPQENWCGLLKSSVRVKVLSLFSSLTRPDRSKLSKTPLLKHSIMMSIQSTSVQTILNINMHSKWPSLPRSRQMSWALYSGLTSEYVWYTLYILFLEIVVHDGQVYHKVEKLTLNPGLTGEHTSIYDLNDILYFWKVFVLRYCILCINLAFYLYQSCIALLLFKQPLYSFIAFHLLQSIASLHSPLIVLLHCYYSCIASV